MAASSDHCLNCADTSLECSPCGLVLSLHHHQGRTYMLSVGQNHVHTLYMTIHTKVSLPKIPYSIHREYVHIVGSQTLRDTKF